MARNYVQKGNVIDFTNNTGSDIASGDAVPCGSLLGVAITDIADGETGSLNIEGVWELPKVEAAEMGQGDPLNWDLSAAAFVSNAATPETGDLVGGCVAIAAAVNGDTTVRVRLNLSPSTVSV